jgi:membrane associated rhomboid family serine protease
LPSSFIEPVVVFRSARRGACDERALVLVAVGIACEIQFDDGYVLLVESGDGEEALKQLALYEQDRRRRPPLPPEAPPPRRGAWRGSLVYVALLLLVPITIAKGWFDANLYEVGAMDPQQFRAGQWWRALTALTLHWDGTHLLGNLAAGALLGISAAQVWGNARAWLLIGIAAICANIVEGTLPLGLYTSAGASTAVFAALGLVAAHAWRSRATQSRSLRDWAPLIAGIALLGMFGAGAQDPEAPVSDPTNVLSHALGFLTGALLGFAVATRTGARLLDAMPAWVAAAILPAWLLVAWTLALHGTPSH